MHSTSITPLRCDLHTHSIFSDGSYTPAKLLDEAERIGLSALALTDHNTVDGLPDLIRAASGKRIDAVPGAEFSVDYDGCELHLLGLWIDPSYFSQVSDWMLCVSQQKEESNRAMIDSMARAGIRLDYEKIKSATPNGKVNRAHIAEAMVRSGYVSTVKEAFETVLSPSAGHYREPKRLTVWDMLERLRSIGAVSVLAHPFLNLSEPMLSRFLPLAKAAGLVGMECYYSLYDEATTRASLQMAEEIGLTVSGGSDFHGTAKPDILLGVGKGNLSIPYACYEELKQAASLLRIKSSRFS